MAGPLLLGVNLAGAEFGSNVPGVFGTDYTYPTHTEIDYYAAKGMSVVRLPFLWERVQHSENAPLDAVELGRLDDVVSYATGKGLKIEIEPHNYGYGFGALIGTTQTPNAAFADLWGKLAFHYQSNPDVMFGLMNEPHDQSASAWLGSANAAIAAIRGAGAVSQEILVPGSYWDGAWTWTSTDNDTVIGTGVQDPAHNFAFEVHQYLDADGSGTHAGAVSATIGVERLTAITQWAEATGNHLFLGEVGVTTDQTSLTAFDGMLTYMQQHTGAWQGVTYWAGGPWWGNYMFSIEPQNGIDKPQMGILLQHLDGPVNHAPVVTVPNSTVHATAGQTLQLFNLVIATDVDNDTLAYILYDATSGGGHFVVNGLEQPANQIFGVTAAQLAQTTFVPVPGASDDLLVGASDGHVFSGWSKLHVDGPVNHAPVVTVPNSTVHATAGQTLQLSNLVSAADPDNDTLAYILYDATSGGGHFVVNGLEQPANQIFGVTAAQMAQTTFVPAPGVSDDLLVGASDGHAFSGWSNLHVDGPVNHAPVVTVPNSTVHATAGQTLQLSNLVSATDPDNDTFAYILYDATPGGGHFVVNGVTQAANQIFGVTVAQLAQTTFVPGPGQSDDLLVGATDGFTFSGWSSLHIV